MWQAHLCLAAYAAGKRSRAVDIYRTLSERFLPAIIKRWAVLDKARVLA